jgi:hypothetical protein
MEFSSSQIAVLNRLLPNRFKLEPFPKTTKVQPLKPDPLIPALPAKRVQSSSLEVLKKPSELSTTLLKIIIELKNHEKFPLFIQNFKQNSSNPVNIGMIETGLLQNKYNKITDFASEVRQVWNYSFSQHVGRQDLYSATVDLSQFFENQMLGLEKNLKNSSNQVKIAQNGEIVKNQNLSLSKNDFSKNNKKETSRPAFKPSERAERAMGFMEKRNLIQNIRKLDPKYFSGMFDIVRDCHQFEGHEVEIDLETLPAKVSRELDRYVKICLSRSLEGRKKTVEKKNTQIHENLKLSQLTDLKSTVEKPLLPLLTQSSSESSSTSESEEEVPEAPKM